MQKPALRSRSTIWVSQERNEELLKHIPWFPFHDLAMVFFICLDLDSADLVSALVHWPLLSAWDMDADTLRSLAEENTPILFPPVLTPLTELLLPSVYVPGPGGDGKGSGNDRIRGCSGNPKRH